MLVHLSMAGKPEISQINQTIGPIYVSPQKWNDRIYYLASNGRFFESDLALTTQQQIFKTAQPTISGVLIFQGIAYFGDGLHEDNSSNFYAFDLKKRKLIYRKSFVGHLEKTPVVYKKWVLVSLGPGGLVALDKASGDLVWKISRWHSHNLHIDSTPLILGQRVCFSSIYKQPSIHCANIQSGQIQWSLRLLKPVKTDLIKWGSKIVALGTHAQATHLDRDRSTDLMVISSEKGRILLKRHLRGNNLFPQRLVDNELFLAMSTGDVLSFNLKTKQMTYFDVLPEPIMSTPFHWRGSFCAATIQGRIVCYGPMGHTEEKVPHQVLGVVEKIGKSIYLPTRAGYLVLREDRVPSF